MYSDREACAIPDPDNGEIIITGGMDHRKLVSVYNEAGWQRDLTQLNQGRKLHACGSYFNGGEKVNDKFEWLLFLAPTRSPRNAK